ncbi:hypothetical protein ACFQZC_37220 [Streptacidiphilus monticola]
MPRVLPRWAYAERTPRPPTPAAVLRRRRAGLPALTGAVGAACCLAAARWRPAWRGRAAVAAVGSAVLASTGVYLHTTLHGKLSIWERELDRIELQGDERLLDLGCGRGAVLIQAARRLPRGRPTAWTCGPGRTRAATTPRPPVTTPLRAVSPIASNCTRRT